LQLTGDAKHRGTHHAFFDAEPNMTAHTIQTPPMQPLLGQLGRALIDEFVRARGYDPRKLTALNEGDRHSLRADASTYASTKLMEIEARSHFVHEMHGDAAG
jgi:hypothetical protein